ncbi:hypothetical protein TIFTF001_053110 [Ficus carica]|uniref:Uncharacterized protein n=1 Tax=Ficus carica TaxID=3494 RepID=A0AA88ELP4_FICCA|nr:hypothetical protein TIFTF001_053110 [Ficus carica]
MTRVGVGFLDKGSGRVSVSGSGFEMGSWSGSGLSYGIGVGVSFGKGVGIEVLFLDGVGVGLQDVIKVGVGFWGTGRGSTWVLEWVRVSRLGEGRVSGRRSGWGSSFGVGLGFEIGVGSVQSRVLGYRMRVGVGHQGRCWVSGRDHVAEWGSRSGFGTRVKLGFRCQGRGWRSGLGFGTWVGVEIEFLDGVEAMGCGIGVGVGFQGVGRGSRSGFRSSEGVGFWDGRRRVSGSGLGFRVRIGSDFRTASGSRLGFEVEVGFRNEGGGRGRVFKWGWGQGWVSSFGSIFEMGIDIGSVSG